MTRAGDDSSHPISVSSSSIASFHEADSSGDSMDLGRALDQLERRNQNSRAVAGPSRQMAKPTRPVTSVPAKRRDHSREVDGTLFHDSDRPRKKGRPREREVDETLRTGPREPKQRRPRTPSSSASQMKMTDFIKSSPSSGQKRDRRDTTAGPSRHSVVSPLRRNTSSTTTDFIKSSPSSSHRRDRRDTTAGPSRHSVAAPLHRNTSSTFSNGSRQRTSSHLPAPYTKGGTSFDNSIFVDSGDDDDTPVQPRQASRPATGGRSRGRSEMKAPVVPVAAIEVVSDSSASSSIQAIPPPPTTESPRKPSVNGDRHRRHASSNSGSDFVMLDQPPAPNHRRGSVIPSPRRKPKPSTALQPLVPETAPLPASGDILVPETAAPRPRNTGAVASQSTVIPDSVVSRSTINGRAEVLSSSSRSARTEASSSRSINREGSMSQSMRREGSFSRALRKEGSSTRHFNREGSSSRYSRVATPEERQERQRRANEKALTPQPPPPKPSILEGLAGTPTPKKKKDFPTELPRMELSSGTKRRLFTAAANPDDESFRPNPRSAFARPPKAQKIAAYQANRPRRSVPEPGKYALPTVDTPLEQWPSRPGTSHQPQRKSKSKSKSVERQSRPPVQVEARSRTPSRTRTVEPGLPTPARAYEPPPRTPSRAEASKPRTPLTAERKTVVPSPKTPDHRRSRSVSSALTPLPPTQLPASSPAVRSPLPPPRGSQSLAVVVEEPSPSRVSEDERQQPSPSTAHPPGAANAAKGSDTDVKFDDGLDFDLDMYADFANYADSPSQETPSKRSVARLSLSPVALKVLKSPSASRLRALNETSDVGPASPRPNRSQQSPRSPQSPRPPVSAHGTPSKPLQPILSLNGQRLAAEEERERHAEEDRERAQRAAAEREAQNREKLNALRVLEGSDDSDDDNNMDLDRFLKDLEAPASPRARRSTRHRQAEETAYAPIGGGKTDKKKGRLFKELERDDKRGITTKHVDAALSAHNSPERKQPLDLANVDGLDDDVVAEIHRLQREKAQAVEQEAVYSVFWEDDARPAAEKALLPFNCEYVDIALEMLQDVDDEPTMAQLLSCLPVPKPTEVHLNEWLFELAFCARNEELAYFALERLVEFIAHSKEEPAQAPDGLFWLMSAAWYQLGGKVRQTERTLGRVLRDRQTASAFICRIAASAANNGWLRKHCAWFMLCHLAVLAGDSATTTALSNQIASTAADLFQLVSKEGTYESKEGTYDRMLANELASMPLVPQVRAILALGGRNGAARAAIRWATVGLLVGDCKEVKAEEDRARPSASLVAHTLLCIEDEVEKKGDADFDRARNLLTLWCAGLTDLDDGWANDPIAKELSGDIVRVRDRIRDNGHDMAATETKGRLDLCRNVVALHVDTAINRSMRARVKDKGLELGQQGQTRLSFGRTESRSESVIGNDENGERGESAAE